MLSLNREDLSRILLKLVFVWSEEVKITNLVAKLLARKMTG